MLQSQMWVYSKNSGEIMNTKVMFLICIAHIALCANDDLSNEDKAKIVTAMRIVQVAPWVGGYVLVKHLENNHRFFQHRMIRIGLKGLILGGFVASDYYYNLAIFSKNK